MRHADRASQQLDAALERIGRDGVVELHLDRIEDLLVEPDAPPFEPRRSPSCSGLEALVTTLSAAERLPDALTVRIVVPASGRGDVPDEVVGAAFRAHAAELADMSWRDAMATRNMGRRQLPLGMTVGVVAAAIAYGSAYLAAVVDTDVATGVFVVVAMIALTVAWVVGWVVVESAFLDWRLPARRTGACELLASATLEIERG